MVNYDGPRCPHPFSGARHCNRLGVLQMPSVRYNIYRCSKGHTFQVLRSEELRRESQDAEALRSEEGNDEHAAYARTHDPSTSHEAAKRVNVTKKENAAMRGLRFLGGRGNSKEAADAVGEHEWSISPRMKPLERKGLVIRTEERRDKCIVWELTDAGRARIRPDGDPE